MKSNTVLLTLLVSILTATLGCEKQTNSPTSNPSPQNTWTATVDRIMVEEDTFVVAVDFTSDKPVMMSIPTIGSTALSKSQNSELYQGRLVINAFRDPDFEDSPYAYRYITLSAPGARMLSGAGWKWTGETKLSKAIDLHLKDGTYEFNTPTPLLTVGDIKLQILAKYQPNQ